MFLKTKKRKKKERTQISNITNERREITTDRKDIKKTIKKNYEQFYSHKFDNLGEMHQFLERYNLPRPTQEERDNMDRPIAIKKLSQ